MTDFLDSVDYRNIPATLRVIADMVEADSWGDGVTAASLVIMHGDEATVIGMGVVANSLIGTASLLSSGATYCLGLDISSIDEDDGNG